MGWSAKLYLIIERRDHQTGDSVIPLPTRTRGDEDEGTSRQPNVLGGTI